MAVLKGNVNIRTAGGEVLTLTAGTDRDAVEDAGYGPEAQRVLDNPGHWVDALPEVAEETNLLDSERRSIRPRPSRKAKHDDADESDEPKSKGRRPAPKGVVEA
jgi:hypothetical protein